MKTNEMNTNRSIQTIKKTTAFFNKLKGKTLTAKGILEVAICCIPTSGTACNHILHLVSHGDGTPDNDDAITGYVARFIGNVVTPFD